MRKHTLLSLLLLCALAAPAFAGGAWVGLVLERGTRGARVREVVEGSPGQRSGIVAGEEVVAVDDIAPVAPDILIAQVMRLGVGATIKLSVADAAGKTRLVAIKLEPRPGESQLQRQTLLGKEAPDFSPAVQAGVKLGKISSLRGQVVLIDFFATWCGPCREAMPHLEAMHEKLGKKGLRVIGISTEPAATVAHAAERFGLKYTLASDENEGISASYRVFALPTLVLIDKKGVVREVTVNDEDAIDQAVAAALK